MFVQKRFILVLMLLAFALFGCTSAANRQAIQGDYDNALRIFNSLPPNSKDCAPQEYAKAEATLAHIEEEISEGHFSYAKKYVSHADEQVRDAKSAAKRRCSEKAATPSPPPPPPPPEEKSTFILEGTNFDYKKASISPTSEPTLKEAGSVLKRFTAIKVRIEGHTDNVGSDGYNQKLSERRAASVKDYLVNNFGIDPSRIETVGLGEANPIADNNTDEGRAQNRRIEFVITEQ